MFQFKQALLLLLATAGIYTSYLTQGVVQENLSIKRYGADGDRFPHLTALAGVQSVVCFVWAGLLMLLFGGNHSEKKLPPFTAFWKASISNSIGPACGIQALKNISYPAQVLAKSCKMIPVMLMGTLLYGKTYSMFEYACVSSIASGISLFAAEGGSGKKQLANPNAPLGYALCAANLILDGYTNAAQDEISRKHKDNSALHMMCWMNFWCSLYYGAYLFLFSSVGWQLAGFCQRHPDAAIDVALFCLCGAVGQLFIFFTIRTFGSLVNTIVCTTRKFFNILLSVVWNGHALKPLQWLGVVLVFVGLLASSVHKSLQRQRATKHH